MTMELKVGLIGTAATIVDSSNFAITMGSGDLEVFATPSMIALMEKAACNAIGECLDAGTSSVGIRMDTSHDAATPANMKVTATAELILVEGRKLTFKVSAKDEKETIGIGVHERFVIDREKFMSKVAAK